MTTSTDNARTKSAADDNEGLHAKAPVPTINGNRALYLTCNPVRITWEMAPSEASVLLVRCKAQLRAPCLQDIWAYRESLPYNPSSPVVRMNHNQDPLVTDLLKDLPRPLEIIVP